MDDAGSFVVFLRLVLFAVLWLVFCVGPLVAFLFGMFFCVTLPLRRRERARFFLDLLEGGLRDGKSAEAALVSVADSRDAVMGVRFYQVADCLARGDRLGDALEKVPRMLPPQVAAMLKAGERIGDLRKVLPACRRLLADAESTRGAMNFVLVVMAYFVIPTAAVVMGGIEIFVLPRFVEMARDMEATLPPELLFVTHHRQAILAIQLAMMLIVWLLAFFYVGGPRVTNWFEAWASSPVNWLQHAVPWRRKRMQRDFAAMLAVLLDAGMPEPEALALAADCTKNTVFQRSAAQAVAGLKQGLKLTEAVRVIDDSGEFHWRLTNAFRAQRGFLQAMAGWNRALDAQAFQQEQAAAQLFTTGLVVVNGVFIGLFAISVFRFIISLINLGVSW